MRWMPFAAVLAIAAPACSGPPVDLTKALQLNVVQTGWYDDGIVDGKNKLVPSITVQVKNASDQTLSVLQLNSLFRQVNATEEWGSRFLSLAGSEGLKAGATAGPVLLKSNNGYTGADQSRQEMLQNSHFVDAKVEVFAKYGSTQWVKMGEYPIERKLLEKS